MQAELLAIVEVGKEKRVRCQAPHCTHSVYRRIHIVRQESGIHVYGSSCFKHIFEGLPIISSPAIYTHSGGSRELTDEERRLLIENTEELIRRFEAEHQSIIAGQEKLKREISRKQLSNYSFLIDDIQPEDCDKSKGSELDKSIMDQINKEARDNLDQKFGTRIDWDSPGYKGLLSFEVERLVALHHKDGL